MDWRENKADEAIGQYVSAMRSKRASVVLHETGVAENSGRMGLWGRNIARYSIAAAVLAVGLVIFIERPQKIYGYINEVPVTDKEQAIEHTRQMFNDLAVGMAPAEDVLGNLFTL